MCERFKQRSDAIINLILILYHVSFITIYSVFVYTGWKIDDRILNVLTVTLPPLEKLTTIE